MALSDEVNGCGGGGPRIKGRERVFCDKVEVQSKLTAASLEVLAGSITIGGIVFTPTRIDINGRMVTVLAPEDLPLP